MEEKERIVMEAYEEKGNIRKTAEKFDIQPTNIRQWRKRLSLLKRKLAPDEWERVKKKHQYGAKGKRKNEQVFRELRIFFDNLREQHRVVSVFMLCTQYKILASCAELPNKILQYRIYRWLKREGLVDRRITHQAQNTRPCLNQMQDFVQYINAQIERLGIPKENVVNADETNVDFSIDSTRTLNVRGERTVSVRQAKSSQRATVLLAVSLTGEKLLPYIIFKGKPGRSGRVAREFTNASLNYPDDIKYAVQEKAWMDEEQGWA